MSEEGWIAIITLVIGAVQAVVVLYFRAKFNVQIDKQDQMLEINSSQNKKLTDAALKLEGIHTDINSSITELIDSKLAEAQARTREIVRAAVEEAIRAERERVKDKK